MPDLPNRRLRFSFDKESRNYRIFRRDHLKKLIADVIKTSNLSINSRVLDIGCGTGKSTIPFARTGAEILGIDISQNMINEAKKVSKAYRNISYKRVSFEKAVLPDNYFDLITSGSSFHWLDRKSAYRKINKTLKGGGHLAIFWSSGPQRHTKLSSEVREIYAKHSVTYPKGFSKFESTLLAEIKKSSLFKNLSFRKYQTTEKYTKRQYLNRFTTLSFIICMEKNEKEALFKDLRKLLSTYASPICLQREYKLILAEKKP